MAKTYNFLFEVTPLNGTTPTTLRLTNISADKNATTANGQSWLPCITSMPDTGATLSADGLLDDIKIERGELSFFCSNDFTNHVWSSYVWNNAFYRAWYGENGTDFASYTLFGEGRTTNLERDGNQVTVRLLGPEADVTSKLLSNSYTGIGGAEGPLGFKGNLKPRCFGTPLSVEPVELDPVNLVYQVHGYGAVASIQPYEYGLPLEADQFKGNAASYAALIALPLVSGEYATCLAEGMFRFGGTPTPKITADVTMPGGTSLADIANAILTAAGVPANKIGSFAAVSSVQTNLYVTGQVEALEALQSLFRQAGCFVFADKSGVWQCGKFYASTKSAITLNSDRSTFPILLDWKEDPTKPPIKKVSYGFQRCWGVHSDSEASPIVNELAQQAENAALAAVAAQTTADNAQSLANDAKGVADTALDAVKDDDGTVIKSKSIQEKVNEANADIAELIDTYGSTATAAASANAAKISEDAAKAAATTSQTASNNAAQAKADAEAAEADAIAAKTAAETARSQAQTAATNAGTAKTAAETAKTAAETAKAAAQTAKTDAETAFSNSTTAKNAAVAAQGAAETARNNAQTYATNASNSATAASGSASTASTKATEAGNSATAAQASNVSATSTYNDLLNTVYNQPLLPFSFEEGTKHWTRVRNGAPATLATTAGTQVTDADLGQALQFSDWTSAGTNILSKGAVAVSAGRIYEVTVRFKVTASDGSVSFNPILATMAENYVGTDGSSAAFASGGSSSVTANNVVQTFTAKFAIGGGAGIASLPSNTKYIRPGLRLNSSETGLTLVIGEIRLLDVTEREASAASANAASTSASAAATSATDAGTSASAAQTSATTAATQAGKASTSATNAATSETNAKGSENAAKTSQTAAATSATNAGNSATAAATSASTASSKATEASQSASTATTQANTATTKAGEASTSATNAATSESNALGSKNAAATSATNAATSATNAGNSATAASGSASTAGTKATEAGNAATSAAASAVSANSTYNSTLGALYVSSPILPSTFDEGAKHWTNQRTGNPTSLADIPGTAVIDADMGPSLEFNNWAGAGNNILTKGVIAPKPGRIYEVSVSFKITQSDGSVSFNIALGTMLSGFGTAASNYRSSTIGNYSTTGSVNVLTGKFSLDTISGVTTIPADVVLFRAGLRLNSSETSGSLVFRVGEIRITDVTEREAALASANGAAASASAAATSASTASTNATNAGTSATSASNSANTATTKAGEASTSASNAATSESNANASKNAASTSATNAANSATNAGNSASAASGSASNAQTSATNAGNSASSAAAAAVSASSSFDGAKVTAASLLPSDFMQDGLFWSHTFTGVPGSQAALSNAVSFVDVANVGRVAQMGGTTTYRYIAPLGAVSVIAGRTYRLTMSVRATSATAPGVRLYGIYLSSSYGQIGQPSTLQTLSVQNQWYNVTIDVTGDAVIAGSGAYLRPLLRLEPGETHTIQLAFLKIEDVTSQLAAASSASAAATSASSAGTSATNAGNSANSATQSANTASTKANEASNSATSAANSASSASSSSTDATNSATAANSSDVSAKLSAASQMPSDFQQDGKFWQQGFGGLPAALNPITANSTFAFVNNSDVGRSMRVTATAQTDVGNIGMMPLQADRVYRITAKVRQQTGSVFAQLQLFRIGVNTTGSTMGNGTVQSTYTFTALNQWVELTGTVPASTTNAMIAAGASSIRCLLRLLAASSTVTVDYSFIRIEDITESTGAAGSASAAANSASQASASQSAAGSSASSAQTSATNAATSAGQASTSASNASTSANNAAGSANTASTQATNASNSANAASGSATSASNSASAASTSASNAGNSASTSAAQALYAGSYATGNFIAKPTFEDGSTGMWNGSVSVTSYSNGALGTTKELRSQARDATEGAEFIPLPQTNDRVFRISGYARCGSSSAYPVNVGIQGQLANGSYSFPYSRAANAGVTTWSYFEFNLGIPANILRFKPFVQSQNDAGQAGSVHDARVVGLRIEDVTESNSAAGSASAAATSASNAQTSATNAGNSASSASGSANTAATQANNASNSASAAAGSASSAATSSSNAGSSATSASNSANTASTKANEASSSASAASGSAATASSAASTATTQANLTAQYSTGGGNLLTNTEFAVDTSGWWTGINSQSNIVFPINGGGNDWHPQYVNAISVYQQNSSSSGSSDWMQDITIQPSKWYDVSVQVAAHRCQVQVYLQFQNASGGAVSTPSSGALTPLSGGTSMGNWTQVGFKGQAPSDAVKARLYLRKFGTLSNQSDSWAWFMRPQVRETFANAPTPCSYSAGNGSAVATTQQASINSAQTAIATANSSIASLNNSVSTLNSSVNVQQTAINNLNGKTAAYWQVNAVSGGRAQLTVFADSNGGGGVDIQGDIRISGNAMIGGTINPEALALQRFVKRLGPVTAAGNPGATMYSGTLGQTTGYGSYLLEGNLAFTYQTGRSTTTQSGKPYYIDYLQDGGLTIYIKKNGVLLASASWTGTAQSTYASRSFTAALTTNFDGPDPDTFTGDVTIEVVPFKGNTDTGMVNQGDYYSRQISGNYLNFSINNLRLKWTFI
ncbi:hypothetical protein N6H05_23895 [Sphingobium sp. WTD-1]|uniref:hypothetical protein n=1 Tax=Sphingobium sp. WTD-1 TaxID=2979467 RepID=UPI0024DE6EEC|nr:hypothetical protein [Sphingobium sp. WTD-1]WIA56023.1 hypothetical protein N6H05_23895 [Sphingobium sp. WTD-1]